MAITGNASQMVFRAKGKGSKVHVTDPYISIEQTDEGAVVTVTDSRGSTQATIYNGVGIVSIEKTGTEGLVDTYTITLTDGTTVTYTVTNGQSYTVDDELSPSSENPVQNKVVYNAIPKNVKDGGGTGSVIEGLVGDDVPEDSRNIASGIYSHAEGSCYTNGNTKYPSTASGQSSHSEGCGCTASGKYSHAEGCNTQATSNNTHSENAFTTASGFGSHAEGQYTTASGQLSHAEGSSTLAAGKRSHAEGMNVHANGDNSHSQNEYTIADGKSQTVIGRNNVAQGSANAYSDTDYAFIIGNGVSPTNRSNALAVRWDGALVLTNGTILTATQLSDVVKLSSVLSSGTTGQFLMSDGNGGFQWVNLADIKVYPGGVKL